ncbi:MAG: 4-(cytidine 5'-diphospho)-2-C-methyl-D-erythritol kinase [Pseudomonadota bacterium]
MSQLNLLAPAKINLFLHVTGRRSDGYHTLQTAFQFLNWYDNVDLEANHSGKIVRHDINSTGLPEDDLTIRAARLLQQYSGIRLGADITLRKNIPAGAGLGGGSSDAAATLMGLNTLWKTHLNQQQLLELAALLGADVPIFVFGHAAWAEGIGDELYRIDPEERWYCLVMPDAIVPTAAIFEHPDLKRDTASVSIGDLPDFSSVNDLEAVTRTTHPIVDRAFSRIGAAHKPQLNGSGSSIFLPCNSEQDAERIAAELARGQLETRVCRAYNSHPHLNLVS